MSKEREHAPLGERVAVMPPNPPPQQRTNAPRAVVGGLTPGTDDEGALKSKETIPGGLTINSSGFYQNAKGEYVDKTGKVVDQSKPVKASKGETPVQDYLAAQDEKAATPAPEEEA